MNNQQSEIAIFDLGAKFGAHLAQIYAEIIALEKVTESQRIQIQNMTENETRLTDHIQDLEDELTSLKSENFELQQMAEAQPLLSPKSQELAEASRAIIQGDPSN
jgi:cell division protein FtsB